MPRKPETTNPTTGQDSLPPDSPPEFSKLERYLLLYTVKQSRADAYDLQDTSVEGVHLIVEPELPGDKPIKIAKGDVQRFANDAVAYARTEQRIVPLARELKENKKSLATFTKGPRLRGIQDDRNLGGVRILHFPQQRLKLHRDRLMEELGDRYPLLIRDRLTINITVPTGGLKTEEIGELTPEFLKTYIREQLADLGLTEGVLDTILDSQIVPILDDEQKKQIGQLIRKGEVRLTDEAGKLETQWKPDVGPLLKP